MSDGWPRGLVLPAGAGSGRCSSHVGPATACEERPGACAIIPPRSGRTCPDAPSDTDSEDTHGPLLRDLRQGFDGRLQPAVVGHEPRPSPPPDATEPPAARHRREGLADEGAGLHALPTDAAEVVPVVDAGLTGPPFRFPTGSPRWHPVVACPGQLARGSWIDHSPPRHASSRRAISWPRSDLATNGPGQVA